MQKTSGIHDQEKLGSSDYLFFMNKQVSLDLFEKLDLLKISSINRPMIFVYFCTKFCTTENCLRGLSHLKNL